MNETMVLLSVFMELVAEYSKVIKSRVKPSISEMEKEESSNVEQ